MKPIVGGGIIALLLIGGNVIANHYRLDFVQGLVVWLLCAVVPYLIGWAVLKTQAPHMLAFYNSHPTLHLWEMGAWFVISLVVYATTTSLWRDNPTSGAGLLAAMVFAMPITAGLGVAMLLNERFQAWASKEVQRLSGGEKPMPAAPDVEWKPPAPPPSHDPNTFDPDRFKRD